MILLGLFLSFLQIGFFAFGGGLATIPFIRDLALTTGWFNIENIMNMIAVSEATPGPLGINMATYVGFLTASVPGSIIAVLGVVLPSILVIIFVSRILEIYRENKKVKRIFYGLRASSVALIFLAFFETVKITILDLDAFDGLLSIGKVIRIGPLCIATLIFYLIQKWKLHPVCYLLFAAVIGIIFQL